MVAVSLAFPSCAGAAIKGQHIWVFFGLLSLAMCILEELLCYLTGTGMWESRSRFWPEFLVWVWRYSMGWTVGSGLVLRFSGLGVWEALILCGFSGWLAEAFVVPRFVHAPLLLIWIIPLSIVSYLLLILPGMAVVRRYLPQPPVDQEKQVRSYLGGDPCPCRLLAWRGDLHGALLQAVTGLPLGVSDLRITPKPLTDESRG